MALRDRGWNPYLERARERLIKDPQDNLRDIGTEMNDRDIGLKEQCKFEVMWDFVGRVLFNRDYRKAKAAVSKVILLKPPEESIGVTEANKILVYLWFKYPFFDMGKLLDRLDSEIRKEEELRKHLKEEDKV